MTSLRRILRANWGWGLLVALSVLPTTSHSQEASARETRVGSIEAFFKAIAAKDEVLSRTLRRARTGVQRENQRAIFNYYNDLRMRYLEERYTDVALSLSARLGDYQTALESAVKRQNLSAEVYQCVGTNSRGGLRGDIDRLRNAIEAFGSELSNTYDGGNLTWDGDSNPREELRSRIGGLSEILSSEGLRECCRKKSDLAETAEARASRDASCSELVKAQESARSALLTELVVPPIPRDIPNPLADADIDGDQLAIALRDRKTLSQLRKARGSEGNAHDEMAILEELNGCIKDAEHRQSGTRPAKVAVMEAVGKAIKCSLLPALATHYFDTPWQKLTLGAASIPIEGDRWNINCDPSEIAMWDQMRSMDPAQIQQQWGIPQMANPPWIASLRALPPMSTPFPVVGVTAEDLIRASPQWAFTPAPAPAGAGPGGDSDTPVSRFRSGGGTSTARSSGSGSSDLTNGSSRFRSSTTGQQGRAFVQLTRATSSEIRRGRNPQKNSAQMASAARSTRNFFGASRRKVTPSELKKGRTAIASSARRLVSISAGSTASRSSSGNVLSSIRALPPRSNPASGGGGGGVGGVSRRDREIIGQQLKAIVDGHLTNIRFSMGKADELRQELMRKMTERDFIVQKLAVEIVDKAPVKIGDKVMSAQQKLLNIDGELGALKAQYDVYEGTVREQSMFINRVLTFGIQGAQAGSLPELSNVPSNFPSGLRGASTSGARGAFFNFFRLFQLPEAWAAAVDADTHWLNEWERFVGEYGAYAESRAAVDEENRRAVSRFLNDRTGKVEATPLVWMNTETLLSAKMFMSEVLEESEHLVGEASTKILKLDPMTFQNLKESREESQAALVEVIGATQDILKATPASYADNPEVWLGMLPDLLLY